jgi:hypothetical protein
MMNIVMDSTDSSSSSKVSLIMLLLPLPLPPLLLLPRLPRDQMLSFWLGGIPNNPRVEMRKSLIEKSRESVWLAERKQSCHQLTIGLTPTAANMGKADLRSSRGRILSIDIVEHERVLFSACQ